jgi:hypothetical protein
VKQNAQGQFLVLRGPRKKGSIVVPYSLTDFFVLHDIIQKTLPANTFLLGRPAAPFEPRSAVADLPKTFRGGPVIDNYYYFIAICLIASGIVAWVEKPIFTFISVPLGVTILMIGELS